MVRLALVAVEEPEALACNRSAINAALFLRLARQRSRAAHAPSEKPQIVQNGRATHRTSTGSLTVYDGAGNQFVVWIEYR